MLSIQLYLKNQDHKPIFSLDNVQHNPFKNGDIVQLSVKDIPPRELNKINNHVLVGEIIKQNKQGKEQFHLKNIKLIEENKYVHIGYSENKVIIEYFCEFI